VTRSSFQGNSIALMSASSGGTGTTLITVSGSMIVGSTVYGYYQQGTGSAIHTLGNNHYANNALGHGSMTLVPLQ
jgi:hypothetical protein